MQSRDDYSWNLCKREAWRFHLQHASLEINVNIYMEGVLRSQQWGYSLKPVHSGTVPSMRRQFFGRPFIKRFALCYRTIVMSVCLSCLSVTLVYCGRTVGWIKTKLGTEVGLCPGHTVLDWDPKGRSPPNFWPMSIVTKRSPIWATAEHWFYLLTARSNEVRWYPDGYIFVCLKIAKMRRLICCAVN